MFYPQILHQFDIIIKYSIITKNDYIIIYSKSNNNNILDEIKKLYNYYKYEPTYIMDIDQYGNDYNDILNNLLVYLPSGGYIIDYNNHDLIIQYIDKLHFFISSYPEYQYFLMNYDLPFYTDFIEKYTAVNYITPFDYHYSEDNRYNIDNYNIYSSQVFIIEVIIDYLLYAFDSNIYDLKDINTFMRNNNLYTDIGLVNIDNQLRVEYPIRVWNHDNVMYYTELPIPYSRFYLIKNHCEYIINSDNYIKIALIHNIYGVDSQTEINYLDKELYIISNLNDKDDELEMQPTLYLIHNTSELSDIINNLNDIHIIIGLA